MMSGIPFLSSVMSCSYMANGSYSCANINDKPRLADTFVDASNNNTNTNNANNNTNNNDRLANATLPHVEIREACKAKDSKYKLVAAPGQYTMDKLAAMDPKYKDNTMSAFVVPKGVQVTLYDAPDLTGSKTHVILPVPFERTVCTKDRRMEGEKKGNWNNRVSSVSIEFRDVDVSDGRVIVGISINNDTETLAFRLKPGKHSLRQLTKHSQFRNDSIRYLYIPPSREVTIYEKSKLNGASKTFPSEAQARLVDLRDVPGPAAGQKWEDLVSSVRIVRKVPGTSPLQDGQKPPALTQTPFVTQTPVPTVFTTDTVRPTPTPTPINNNNNANNRDRYPINPRINR
jgi:hypothetical protein